MQLREFILEKLAEMAIGDNSLFPYKSSSTITKFCRRCDLPFTHDGTTRKWWMTERLKELNHGPSQGADLPSDDLLRIISETLDYEDFERAEKDRDAALIDLNKLLGKQGLEAYFDSSGTCFVRNNGTGIVSKPNYRQPRPLTAEEIQQKSKVAAFLDASSEDEFTEQLLVPLFQRLVPRPG